MKHFISVAGYLLLHGHDDDMVMLNNPTCKHQGGFCVKVQKGMVQDFVCPISLGGSFAVGL